MSEKNQREVIRTRFKEKIDRLKEVQIIAKTRYEHSTSKRSYLSSEWSFQLLRLLHIELQEIWEFLENVTFAILDVAEETTSNKDTLKNFRQELENQKPILTSFKQVLDKTEELIKKGK